MKRRVDRSDREIADALRAGSSEPVFRGSLDSLASRIDAAAAPFLALRRQGHRSMMWSDYAAEWSRMLVPAGLTVAAASVMTLWIMRPVSPVAAESAPIHRPAVSTGAGGRTAAPADVVDRAVEELIGSAAAPAPRRRR